MSVIVKGMKMPDSCERCPLHFEEDVDFGIVHQCYVKNGYIYENDVHTFPSDCPLVELPEKHNRLLDARKVMWAFNDAILDEAKKTGKCRATWNEVYSIVTTVPTVFEAEGEE